MTDDMSWIVSAIKEVGIIIGILIAGILSYLANKNAKEANTTSKAGLTAVDGRMTELLELTRKQAASEATEIEKGAENERKVAITAAVEVPVLSDQQTLKVAEDKAMKLLAEAAAKAAALLKGGQ